MIVYYFGADSAWDQQDEHSIRRRNMAILLAIANDESILKVYNIIRTTRSTIFKSSEKVSSKHPKIENLYVAPIVPERGILKRFAQSINRVILKFLYRHVFNKNENASCIAWCYWPQGFLDYEFLNLQCEMVFDTDHNIIDDPNIPIKRKEMRELLLLKAAKQSHYIISSSRSMLKWFNDHDFKNTKLLLNGVFEQRVNLKSVANSSLNNKVTYCGTLSKWIQSSWLIQIIEEHPDWTFNFIGKDYKTDIELQLQSFPNVKMFGFLEPKEVNVLLKQSNVCFGLYKKDSALDVNSMKLYDYLAQGVPVVVNDYHPNLKQDFNELLNIASTYEDFKSMLQYPKPINKGRLQEFLKDSTWGHRVKPMLACIND